MALFYRKNSVIDYYPTITLITVIAGGTIFEFLRLNGFSGLYMSVILLVIVLWAQWYKHRRSGKLLQLNENNIVVDSGKFVIHDEQIESVKVVIDRTGHAVTNLRSVFQMFECDFRFNIKLKSGEEYICMFDCKNDKELVNSFTSKYSNKLIKDSELGLDREKINQLTAESVFEVEPSFAFKVIAIGVLVMVITFGISIYIGIIMSDKSQLRAVDLSPWKLFRYFIQGVLNVLF